jgi:hypothetical protein
MLKQKLHDLILILKNSRKAWFFIGISVIAALFLLFYDSRPARRLVRPAPPKKETTLVANESASDVIEAFNQQVEQLKTDSLKVQKENTENRQVMEKFEVQVVAIFGKMLNRLTETEQKLDEALQRVDKVSTTSGPHGTTVVTEEAPENDPIKIVPFGDLEEPEPAPPPKPGPERLAIIGAGDSVEVELIAGVNAATDGTPYPTLFRLVGDVTGPDGTMLPLGEARLIGAAQGSLVDSRVLFRLNQLNINLPNGEKKVYSVDGWIVGEDGIVGMPGIPIDPLGRILAGVSMVGAIQGLGQGIQTANQTIRRDIQLSANQGGFQNGQTGSSVVDIDSVGQFAAGSALATSANEWNRLLRDRVKDMVPVIKVYSGRKATAIFDKSLPIEGLYKQIADGNSDYEEND